MTDTSNSGIYVTEDLGRGQPIPAAGESVTAFVGPAPRGPVDHAVRITSSKDFRHTFGVPDYHSRLESAVSQFFANGGTNAVVVRVSATTARSRIALPGPAGELVLEARHPGPLEYLRASVDYDGIAADQMPGNELCFNLIVQRLRAAGSAWIDAQECYRHVSVDPSSRDFVGYVLAQSELVQLHGEAPAARPDLTIKPTTVRQAGYVNARAERMHCPPPDDYDLIGSAALGTGISALEHIADIGQVCLLAGTAGQVPGPVAMLAADRFCRARQCLLIVDPPDSWSTAQDAIDDQQRSGFSSPNAVTWFPPTRQRDERGQSMPASMAGAVAAALSVADYSAVVARLPLDEPLIMRGQNRLRAALSPADTRRLARAGINSLVRRSPLHLQLLGNVTHVPFGGDMDVPNQLELRRRLLFILRRIRIGTRWTFFVDSGPDVWAELRDQVTAFMSELQRQSILAGDSAATSFFVKCDADTNAGLLGQPGALSFVLGIALSRSGEFVAFRFQYANGTCRISRLGWQSVLAEAV